MKLNSIDKKMIETIATLVEAVSDIRENHLVHMQARLEKIDDRIWRGGVAIITTLVGILVAVIIK